jgi:hypothetical protein
MYFAPLAQRFAPEVTMRDPASTGLRVPRFLLAAVLGLLVSACGGGGGGDPLVAPTAQTLSGTAAAGAPIIGTVTVKDSSPSQRTRTVTIEADGDYTVDVSDLTPPLMLRAEGKANGRQYSLHSAAAAADVNGRINITPLTDLIVANIAGDIAATFFDGDDYSRLTTAELNAAEATLRQRLQPILAAAGVGGAIDLLRASFATDRTGLDAALEALRVEVDPATATATIISLIDGQRIVDDLASRTDTSVLPAPPDGAAALSDLLQIVAAYDGFNALFATSMPAHDNAALNALLTDDFLFDGQDRAMFLSEITSQNLVGLQLTVLALEPGSLLPAGAPTAALVHTLISPPGEPGFEVSFEMRKVAGSWRNAGNRRIAAAEVYTFARLQDVFDGMQLQPDQIDSGLTFEIKDEGGIGISYAVVTGKGLPAEGLLYVNYNRNSSFGVAAGPYNGEATPRLLSNGHNQYPLADAVIATLSDTESYSVELWRDNGTVADTGDDVKLATYTTAITKRPYLVSELTTASFAVVTAPTQAQLRSFAENGGTISPTWTLPAGTRAVELHFFRSGSMGGFDTVDVNLAAAATSASLTIGAPAGDFGTVQGAGFNLFVMDAFGRELVTIYNAN